MEIGAVARAIEALSNNIGKVLIVWMDPKSQEGRRLVKEAKEHKKALEYAEQYILRAKTLIKDDELEKLEKRFFKYD